MLADNQQGSLVIATSWGEENSWLPREFYYRFPFKRTFMENSGYSGNPRTGVTTSTGKWK